MPKTRKILLVCDACRTPNRETVKTCRSCRAPLAATHSALPDGTIYAPDFMLYKDAAGRPRFIVLLGAWLTLFPLVVAALALEIMALTSRRELGGFFLLWFGVAFLAFAVPMLFKITKTYLRAHHEFQNAARNKQLIAEKKWRLPAKRKKG